METISTIEYAQKFQDELPTILAAQRGCPEATERVVSLTLPLRRSLAYRFLPNNPSMHEDAIQVGWMGALKALEKWDPEKRVCFGDWSRYDVSWAIRDFKYKMEKVVARPHWVYRKLSKMNQLPTEDLQQLSDLMSCPVDTVESIQAARASDVTLNPEEMAMDDCLGLDHPLVDHATPSEGLSRSELIGMIMDRTRNLSERERYILDARYGLSEGEPMTHGEIGEYLQLTRQRVEQIESEALGKIRNYFERLDKGCTQPPGRKSSRHNGKRRNFCRRRKGEGKN